MPRPEKVQAVAEIRERLEQAQAVFLAEYAGLSVKEQQTLRRGLREGGAEFKVVKMTLARRAAAELELAELDELLLGPATNGDVRAVLGELVGGGLPDAAAAPRDDHTPVLKDHIDTLMLRVLLASPESSRPPV